MSWSWSLYAVDEAHTRLITRERMRYQWLSPTIHHLDAQDTLGHQGAGRTDAIASVGSIGERNGLCQCSSRGAVGEGLAGSTVELQGNRVEFVLAVS